MKSNDWRHKNVARYTPGNTKILYFFNCLLDGMHTIVSLLGRLSLNELNSKKTYIYFTVASVLILHPCVKVIMHKGKDGLVMEVREIYKISDMIHKAAGWKKENIFLFLNTIFWAVLAFVIGAAAFTLITGTIAGHGVSLFCITGYAGMIIGFFGGSYYLYRKE